MDLSGLTVILPYGMTRILSPVICLLWLREISLLLKIGLPVSGRDVTLQIWVEHGNQHLTDRYNGKPEKIDALGRGCIWP